MGWAFFLSILCYLPVFHPIDVVAVVDPFQYFIERPPVGIGDKNLAKFITLNPIMTTISFTLLIITFLTLQNGIAQPLTKNSKSFPVPAPHQLKWHEAGLGVIFITTCTFSTVKKIQSDRNRIAPVEDYNIFNPEELDTDQWIRAAKAMGAKFAVITATHETGFAIYQSDVNPYSMKALKWSDGKGDIVSDFVKSCRKYDIQPGIYIGIRWNSLFGIHNFKAEGDVKRLEEFGARVEELTAHPLKSTAGTGKIINLS